MSRCRSAGPAAVRSDIAVGDQLVELGVALVDADLHAAAQPGIAALEGVDERLGVQAGRPSPRSSNRSVSSETSSGMPSHVNVWTMTSSPTRWKQPRKAYSSPSRPDPTNRQAPPSRTSHSAMRASVPFGPTHRMYRSGSVCARMSCAGVAAKSRVIRMMGSVGSASMVASSLWVSWWCHDAVPSFFWGSSCSFSSASTASRRAYRSSAWRR